MGSINLDIIVEVARHPRPGETVVARRQRTAHGGKGANQAVAAARLGTDIVFVGAVGSDAAATELLRGLEAEGVDAATVATVDGPSGTAYIAVSDDGENSIIVVPGANAHLAIDGAQVEAVGHADVVLSQCEIPTPAIEAAQAATAGTFVLNAAPAKRLPSALLASVDVLIVNEHEAKTVAGSTEPTALRALECDTVVVTLGARGAQIVTRSDIGYVAAPSVAVRDTTGAGDAFCGAFCSALVQGGDVFEATAWGVAAGSHATTAIGARGGPQQDQLKATLRSMQ